MSGASVRVWACGLVVLLLAICLPHGNRLQEKGRTGVAAQGQQSRRSGEEHVEGDNRPQLI